RMQDLAEHPAADEIQDQHLTAVVAAVLHHDAVAPCTLGGLNEAPAILQCVCHRYFRGCVLSARHCGDADRDVPLPRRCGVDEVEVFLVAHTLEIARPARVPLRPRKPRLFDDVLRALDLFLDDVAHRTNVGAFDSNQVIDVDGAHSADADKADADALDWRSDERHGGRGAFVLTRRTVAVRESRGEGGADAAGDAKLEKVAARGVFIHTYALLRPGAAAAR